MLSEILVGTVVYLASNTNGRKIAKAGFGVLSKLGSLAVKSLPSKIGNALGNVEQAFTGLMEDKSIKDDGG